jgi:hypothetical protein
MLDRDESDFTHRSWIGALAAVALLLAVGLCQGAVDEKKHDPAKNDEATVTFSGMTVGIDPDTGRLRPLSAEEARTLAGILRQRFASRWRTTRFGQRDGGMMTAVVGMEHLNFSVVRRDADGTLTSECLEAAEPEASSSAAATDDRKDR